MTRQYDLIVFDWEGTIAEDSLGHVISILAQEATRLHFGGFDKLLARRYITLGLPGAIKQLFPHLLMYQHEQLALAAQEALALSSGEVYLVDGAEQTIRRLDAAGFKLAIATNKGHVGLERALQTTRLDTYFKVTRSASQVPPKPCPQMLEEIMLEWDVLPNKTLMVGDSVSDIEMAVAIHVDAIGMDFYQMQRDDLLAAGANDVLVVYQQLADYLDLAGGEI